MNIFGVILNVFYWGVVLSSLFWEKVIFKMALVFWTLRLMWHKITIDALTGLEHFLTIVRVNATTCWVTERKTALWYGRTGTVLPNLQYPFWILITSLYWTGFYFEWLSSRGGWIAWLLDWSLPIKGLYFSSLLNVKAVPDCNLNILKHVIVLT